MFMILLNALLNLSVKTLKNIKKAEMKFEQCYWFLSRMLIYLMRQRIMKMNIPSRKWFSINVIEMLLKKMEFYLPVMKGKRCNKAFNKENGLYIPQCIRSLSVLYVRIYRSRLCNECTSVIAFKIDLLWSYWEWVIASRYTSVKTKNAAYYSVRKRGHEQFLESPNEEVMREFR